MSNLKGTPDFSMFNHEEVVNMRLCINKLIGCYHNFPDKKKLLIEMWRELSFASADAVAEMPEKPMPKETVKLSAGLFKKKFIHKKKITLDK